MMAMFMFCVAVLFTRGVNRELDKGKKGLCVEFRASCGGKYNFRFREEPNF